MLHNLFFQHTNINIFISNHLFVNFFSNLLNLNLVKNIIKSNHHHLFVKYFLKQPYLLKYFIYVCIVIKLMDILLK